MIVTAAAQKIKAAEDSRTLPPGRDWRDFPDAVIPRKVLECGCPLPLWIRGAGLSYIFKPLILFSTSLSLLFLSLLVSFSQPKVEPRSPPFPPARGEREARALISKLLSQKPDENSTKTGLLKIRDAKGQEKQIPVRIEVLATATNWISIYQTTASSNRPAGTKLTVIHSGQQPNQYQLAEPANSSNSSPRQLSPNQLMAPFAGSDFWIADLGLEFFHWPKQRVLYTDMRHHKSCDVLESINPQPASDSYSRVLSWITIDPPHAIVHAEAYDTANKLLKQFDPKNLEKINGQYELESMEIRTRKTSSRTILEFDLK